MMDGSIDVEEFESLEESEEEESLDMGLFL